ncbi:MAG: flagellar export protein FliJ [Rhodocyclaceae bacterium]|jgi:flagellar FliJ protein|nr:flagellar export protein FliJ [Rhodocyclaceae bacterium]MCL4757133.1 flagellar export protein FliJ [Rhodocyclaceae bacterium]
MTQPFTLQPLLDLTNSRLDRATRELGRLIANEQEGVRKLELLQTYRDEYQARFHDALRDGIGVEALRNYSAFMARIDEAIEIQRAHLDQSQRHTAAGKQVWMAHRNKVKAFDTLHDRHVERERRKDARDEQRLSDEHSANRHRQREDAGDP